MKSTLVIIAASVFLVGCQQANQNPPAPAGTQAGLQVAQPAAVKRPQNFAQFIEGGKLYAANCAECHGKLAEGHPQWQRPGPDGKYPPPALNGTAHAWHHPLPVLKQTIRDGTQKLGGNMPPWKDKLSEAQIEAIIFWFQSHWPDEIYTAWAEMDARSRESR